MKMFYFRGAEPNFGDELNAWMWPKLLPDFFDEDARTLFVGIGSTIGDPKLHASPSNKIVFGAGFVPHYHAKPDVHDGTWDIRFVRGPRTAARLGLPSEAAISDAALLARQLLDTRQKNPQYLAFMPHWQSLPRGNWAEACKRADIHLIDPRKPVVKVIQELMRAKLVIAEAMHGAILADALRIPWVAVAPINAVHRDKWYDWAESLGITLTPHLLYPSSLSELSVEAFRSAPRELSPESADLGALSASGWPMTRLKQALLESQVAPMLQEHLTDLAAYRLTKLAQCEANLSRDSALEVAHARMEEKLEALKCDYRSVLAA